MRVDLPYVEDLPPQTTEAQPDDDVDCADHRAEFPPVSESDVSGAKQHWGGAGTVVGRAAEKITEKLKAGDFKFSFSNAVTNEKVNLIYKKFIDQRNIYYDDVYLSRNAFLEMNPIFKIKGNRLNLEKGDYSIDKPLIIPPEFELHIHPGTNIKIHRDAGIISYNRVQAVGTETEPITITSKANGREGGIFGIVGNNGDTSYFKHVNLKNLGELFVNGINFSGGLSVYHSNVEMTNCTISSQFSRNGINLKYSHISLKNCLINKNKGKGDYEYA